MVLRKTEMPKIVRQGFTLMEVLVVVAIIMILAGLGVFYYMGQLEETRKSAAKIKIRDLTQAAETYKLHNAQYPASLRQLLVRDPRGGAPLLKNEDGIMDPWDREFQYDPNGTKNNGMQPDIWCLDPNGQPIGNWGKNR